jgi:peptidoglycan/LPS O-acetylase OafA/YrhL
VAHASNRVAALTGARALAGLSILALHFGKPLFVRAPHWAETLRASGYVATSFFIMLSGFVLTIAYARKLADGTLDRRGFIVARLTRLYPCYALALLLMVPMALVHRWGVATAIFGDETIHYKLVTGLAQATMTHVLVPRLVTAWNVPGWCVSIEMWFYVAFPLAVGWMLARRGRALALVLAGTWGFALALSIVYTVVQPDGFRPDHDSTAPWLTLYKFTPYARWPEFFFGCALGALWLRLPADGRGQRWATLFAGGGALATVALLVAGGERIPYTMLHNGTLLPLYGATVWGLMLGHGPLHRALSVRPLVALGDSSYALYTLQLPLMAWIALAAGRSPNALDAPFTALALAVIVAGALVVHFVVEPRAQAWLRPRLERWSTLLPLVPATWRVAR